MSGLQQVAHKRADKRPWLLPGAGMAARYQPIVRVSDREPVVLEALARLDHPRRGMLAPEHFVPQMEGAGLGRRLTERVAAAVFDDLPHFAGLGLTLALNFPLQVLLDGAALSALDAQREAAGIAAERVLIELTERQSLDVADPRQMAAFAAAARRLRSLGYGLAIDDVGPETPNLGILMQLGFTVLKLDRGAVAAPRASRFLRRTIAAAREAGLAVIAEGVADAAGWRRMEDLGVDQIQGFLVAPPMPAAEVAEWLRAWRFPRV